MKVRRVSLFLFSPAVPSTMGAAPAHHKETPAVLCHRWGFHIALAEIVDIKFLV